jgi:plasmid stabilization system protein ParE
MQINFSRRFEYEFLEIYKFIAEDSIYQADLFKKELQLKFNAVATMPSMFRQSIKSDDKTIRDMIFKKNEILILGIFNQNIWKIKK